MSNPSEKRTEHCPLIYIVDDEPLVLDSLTRCVKAAGYAMKAFASPAAAYSEFASAARKPDLLIVDCTMPEINGLELLGRCRALAPALKSISVSGTLTADMVRRTGVKPDACLYKPFQELVLLAMVQLLVG